jgi:hypothetical protein
LPGFIISRFNLEFGADFLEFINFFLRTGLELRDEVRLDSVKKSKEYESAIQHQGGGSIYEESLAKQEQSLCWEHDESVTYIFFIYL